MVFPLIKLGTLALRTVSKPVANRLKQQAGIHPKFRNFIINIAQANHRMTTTMQRRIYSRATDVKIRPLNEEKAVQAAVDLLGEIFLFMVGVAALIFEVQRSSRAEAKKEELRKQEFEVMNVQEFEALRQQDEDLRKEVELLRQKLAEIEQQNAKGRGLAALLNFRSVHGVEAKPVRAA